MNENKDTVAPQPPPVPVVSVDAPAPPPSMTPSTPAEANSTMPSLPELSSVSVARGATRPAADTAQQETREPLPPGTEVGDYTIIKMLGTGGFGIVYQAIHKQDGTIVAIKEHMPEGLATRETNGTYVVNSSLDTEERFKATVSEFIEEVTVLMGISHPGIVPISSAFEQNGTAYYVMPFLEGRNLEVLEQASLNADQQAQEARHNRRLLLNMLSILDYLRMHQIVHRDIKPSNILITEEGSAILLDFGSARQLHPGKVFTNVFTPDFSAPEQSTADSDEEMSQNLGPWTDLYALGACFYYMVTRLFPPKSEMRMLSAVDPYVPLAGRADLEALYGPAFLRAIDRALALDINNRWQSAAAWRIAIGEGLMPVEPQQVRRIRKATIASVGLLAVFAGISFWALRERSLAIRSFDNSMYFIERLLNDFNREISDIPGSTNLQNMLGDHLNTYLDTMERPPGGRDEKLLRSLSASWRNFGALCMQQGKLVEADSALRKSVDLLRALEKSHPDNVNYTYGLATALLNRAQVARSRNDYKQVKIFLSESIAILDHLVKQVPFNPDFRCTLAEAMGEEAMRAHAEGDSDTYKACLNNMLERYRALIAEYPDHVKAREGLGYALQYNAKYLTDQESFSSAAEQLNEARQVFTTLVSQHPYRLSFKKGLSLTFYSLGNLYLRLGDSAPPTERRQYDELALEAFRKHNELVGYLETQDENKAEYPYMLCRALAIMVDILLRNDQPNLAEAYCKTIARKTEQLLKTAPDNADYAMLAANARRGVAMAHSRSPYHAGTATEEFAEYRNMVLALLRKSPGIAHLQFLYTDALTLSAEHALRTEKPQQALAWLKEAEERLEKLVQNDPSYAAYSVRLEKVRALLHNLPSHPFAK